MASVAPGNPATARYASGVAHGAEEIAAASEKKRQKGTKSFSSVDTSSCFSRYSVLIVALYLAGGTAFYAYEEEWLWMDALYFTTLTLTTVGYGDLVPTTDESKLFTIAFIAVGLSLVATCLGIIMGQLSALVPSQATQPNRAARYACEVLGSVLTVGTIVAIGAAFVCWSEGWTLVDSIYWAVVTASSVGYGDLEIESETTRTFAIFYMLFGVGGFAVALSNFGTIIIDIEAANAVKAFVARGVSEEMIDEMDEDGSGAIDRCEFLRYMLVSMGKVEREDVDKILGVFDTLDLDGSGSIDKEDVRLQERERGVKRSKAASAHDPPYTDVMTTGSPLTALKRPLLPS